jgi:hypothetical protein
MDRIGMEMTREMGSHGPADGEPTRYDKENAHVM